MRSGAGNGELSLPHFVKGVYMASVSIWVIEKRCANHAHWNLWGGEYAASESKKIAGLRFPKFRNWVLSHLDPLGPRYRIAEYVRVEQEACDDRKRD